jgi:ribosomal protein L11 methyltransferase
VDTAVVARIDARAIQLSPPEMLEERDWLAESYRALPPFSVGPFFIYGSHYSGDAPPDKIPLLIDAATAFGSGEHGTTSRCLLALDHLKSQNFVPDKILDMGCGSGILAAGAAKLWPEAKTFAADNDPECVRVTIHHLNVNGLSRVKAFQSEGYAAESLVWQDAPFPLIIANILAGPLIAMAAEQARAVAPGGYLILSGLLATQAQDVLAAYAAQGLEECQRFPCEEWMTLLLQKA